MPPGCFRPSVPSGGKQPSQCRESGQRWVLAFRHHSPVSSVDGPKTRRLHMDYRYGSSPPSTRPQTSSGCGLNAQETRCRWTLRSILGSIRVLQSPSHGPVRLPRRGDMHSPLIRAPPHIMSSPTIPILALPFLSCRPQPRPRLSSSLPRRQRLSTNPMSRLPVHLRPTGHHRHRGRACTGGILPCTIWSNRCIVGSGSYSDLISTFRPCLPSSPSRVSSPMSIAIIL